MEGSPKPLLSKIVGFHERNKKNNCLVCYFFFLLWLFSETWSAEMERGWGWGNAMSSICFLIFLLFISSDRKQLPCHLAFLNNYWIDCGDSMFPSDLWLWSGSCKLSWRQTLNQNYCKDLMFILTQVHGGGATGGCFLGGELGV